MCGIVGYFGDNGNGLARVLGAMASILYRAPDSTGAAWFGDEREPLRVRKTVGALSRFVETQLSEGTHPGQAEILIPLWTVDTPPVARHELQKALLRWEGLPEILDDPGAAADFHDLIDAGSNPTLRIVPGTCGAPEPKQSYRLESQEEFSRLIIDGIEKFDLPPLVVRTLVRKAVMDTLRSAEPATYQGIDEEIVTDLLDELFQSTLRQRNLIVTSPEPELELQTAWPSSAGTLGGLTERQTEQQEILPLPLFYGKRVDLPENERDLYAQFRRLLRDSSIVIPEDCSTDAVHWLFRLLDGAVLCRISAHPEIQRRVQRIFEKSWAEAVNRVTLPWPTVYLAEKGLNIFGRAAAAVWTYLRSSEMLSATQEGEGTESGAQQESTPVSGSTDPAALQYFCSPIIAHGRWAIQSPVSDGNAHPFLDAEGRRALVLNGQFSPTVEEELRRFLIQTGFYFRSENSSEYLSVLWGHYFDVFRYEQRHSQAIQAQVDGGLDEYNLGSQTIDYRVFSMIKGRTEPELDALAFREAAGKMSASGGQIAVAGISLFSPRCLFVASHNRPVFLVRRIATEEVMVVSDINAAMGLFSQKMIQEKARELKMLRIEHSEAVVELRAGGARLEVMQNKRKELKEKEERALEAFRVSVLPLEGEQKFARIETRLEGNRVRRQITVTGFDGRPITDIEGFEAILNPLQSEKEYASFFESHLKEIPGRLQDILDTYLPEGAEVPRLSLRRRLLIRRFGHGLGGLERVVLVGMGSSYHAGLMARNLYRELLPDVEILLLRPVEVEHALRLMEPEKDLVILLSWSGTTADMVEFARELEASKISFIVVTNKPYSELGLFAWRSLGVVNLVSGEEVTFSAVKGTCSVLFGAQLLALWLAVLCDRSAEAERMLEKLANIPAALEQLLDDPELVQTVSRWAKESSGCSKGFVFDDLLYTNTGKEAAWKLEENGRRIVCRALDYRDTLPLCLASDSTDNLVLVNVTGKARLGEAIELMKRLFLAGVRFYGLSYEHPFLEPIRFYSRDQVLILPKLEDAYQPLADLVFFYRFTQRLIEEAGMGVPGFPRNRVKSVTTTRSRQKRFPTPAAELAVIKHDLGQLSGVSSPDFSRTTLWEKQAHTDWEREIYQHIRKAAELLSREDPLGALFQQYKIGLERLPSGLFDELGEGGEVLFHCCDRTSWAAGYEAAAVWGRLLQVPLRLFYRVEELQRRDRQLPVVVVASAVPDRDILDQFRKTPELPACWIGPELDEKQAEAFRRSLGYYVLSDSHAASTYGNLYAGVLLLLAAAWEAASPGKGRFLKSLLCSAGKVVSAVLEDTHLKESIDSFWRQNKEWDTAFYISPPSGVGYVWEQLFDATGNLSLEHHVYGDSSHGPIATIDSRVEEKFVRLRPPDEMVNLYGKKRFSEWEKTYGTGLIGDSLRSSGDQAEELRKRGLFRADGNWYLPIAEPHYNLSRDNLIILDATLARYFEQARDEVEIFSARYARMLLISQKGFYPSTVEGELFAGCTAGEPVLLPALNPGGGPIPDLLLPLVSNLTAAAFAASRGTAEGIAEKTPTFTPRQEKQRLLQNKLLLLGDVLVDSNIDLGSLDHRRLAALERLAPLVSAVEGAVKFEVRRFPSERKLLYFLKKQDAVEAEDMIGHFRIVHAQGLSFYLMRAEIHDATQDFLESGEQGWQEVFGASWEALTSGMVQIGESKNGRPLIEVPLLPSSKREGWLLRLFVRYLEWDHSQSLDAQLRDTLHAMHRGMMPLKIQSPGYLTMVNHFNELMQSLGENWADWLIALVPRSWLLYKPSAELTTVLAKRAEELLKIPGETRLEEVGKILSSMWDGLSEIDKQEESSRWPSLFEKLKNELRGER